ncbi:MAG: hypothetical protein ACRCU3_02490 [Eubacteriaceae bacterium]
MGDFEKNMDLALRYLSFKDRTVSEMRSYLIKKNLGEEDVEVVILKLIDYRYLDDQKYLLNYLNNNRNVNHYGSKRLLYDLKKRGIKDSDLHNLPSLFSVDEEKEMCEVVSEKLKKAFRNLTLIQKKKKMADKLLRLGYPSEMVFDCLNHLDFGNEDLISAEEEERMEQKTYEKAKRDYKKYLRVYTQKGLVDKALEYKCFRGMVSKGYSYDLIQEIIAEIKNN